MELRDYLNVLRIRKWIVIQAVVLVTLAAVVVSFLQAPIYEGKATILVSDRDTGAALLGNSLSDFANSPERAIQTQVQLMQLRPLAEDTIRSLGLKTTPEELLQRVNVEGIGQTNVVTISVIDSDPQRAADIANALALAYVDWSKETKRESIRAAANQIEERLDEARAEILALGEKIVDNRETDRNGQPIKDDQLSAELAIATDLYATLAEKLETLRVSEELEIGSGRVVAPAVAEPVATSPQPVRNALLAVVVGLVLGVALALLIEHLDNTIKSTDEAERLYAVPVLGHIPAEKYSKDQKGRLAIVERSGSAAAEAYRVLRNSMDFISLEKQVRTVLVTSAAPSEGKSTVAANLASGLAQAGKKVVLVSCDFRRPATEQFFSLKNSVGLSDVLAGRIALRDALQRPDEERLLILTSGAMPPNPSELLGSPRMQEVIESLEEWGDWVVIDSPPLLAVADPAAVARWADGVLMVARGGVSTRDAAKKSRQLLDQVGANVVGVVIWGIEESGPASSFYGESYYGGYHYQGYAQPPAGARSAAGKHAGTGGSGAESSDAALAVEPSAGRKFADFIGRLLAGLLGFVVIVVLVLVVLYFLDQAYGWGIVTEISQLL